MLSLNARGLRSLEKRKSLLIWLQKQNADIIFLQETYSTKDIENIWKCQWKGSIYFAHGSNRSCGVLILVKDSLEFDLKSILADDNGRYILLNAIVQVAKKHIYECRKNSTRPSFKVFYKTLAYVYQLELQVMKSNNKESSHNLKWRKYIDNLEKC